MKFPKACVSILWAAFALGTILFPVMALAAAGPAPPLIPMSRPRRVRRLAQGAVAAASSPCSLSSPLLSFTLPSWYGWHAMRRHEGMDSAVMWMILVIFTGLIGCLIDHILPGRKAP